MADLRILIDGHATTATWLDRNPETRQAIEAALPVTGDAARWGDELYFRTGIDVPAEDATETVPEGTVAYWPEGNAICLFWGPTPASQGDEPRAASAVNPVARLADVSVFEGLSGGAHVELTAVE